MIMNKGAGLVFFMFSAWLIFAQELDSELTLCKVKYQESVEALEKQKADMISKASQQYLVALASVEKAATEKRDMALVAASMNEREALTKGMLELEMPAALPKFRLNLTRTTLIKNLEKVDTDLKKLRKNLDIDYLRILGLLETKVVIGSELAKQVEEEKKSLLARNTASITDSSKATVIGKNAVMNGGFEKTENKKPEGWTSNQECLIVREVGNSFVRLQVVSPANDGSSPAWFLEQTISIPKGATQVKISGKIRTRGCLESKELGPFFALRYTDTNGKVCFYSTKWQKENIIWNMVMMDTKLEKPPETGTLYLHNGYLSGQLDFDDVVVTFR